tara:strand:+ start:678 stop:1046 length:369 start_codon:yes stop_codon:yes gene_type:complete
MNSNEIKELRKKYFSNQQSFADICGFGRASVQRWEAGKKQPLKSHLILMELYRDIPAVREYLTKEREIYTDGTLLWNLYKNTDKGWQVDGSYSSKKEAEYYLEEWQEEFPDCKFKIEENKDV